mmetsp:Transcript_26151/g.26382  ORF Transcript_26151/g.26382 Transcript_26151/m.26382 type:complete len:116 (+) Transcript_26151:91-438(+)
MKIIIVLCLLTFINIGVSFHVAFFRSKLVSTTHLFAEKVALTAKGKRVEVDAGSSMLAACKKLGLKVPLDCKKGDCGTCTVTVGGNKIRSCVGKVPSPPKLKSIREKGLPVSVDN